MSRKPKSKTQVTPQVFISAREAVEREQAEIDGGGRMRGSLMGCFLVGESLTTSQGDRVRDMAARVCSTGLLYILGVGDRGKRQFLSLCMLVAVTCHHGRY